MSNLVTVIIPIYNVEKYLNRCIDSVVCQTYRHLEIILVDDGSPDNCPQLCDAWAKKDNRIKVIHKKNEGLGMARNTGLDNATGDYICFFDSDDYIEPDTIEKCVDAAIKNSADLVVFGHDVVTQDNCLQKREIPCSPKQLYVGDEIKSELLPMSVYADLATGADWNMTMSAWNKLYSMSVIKDSGWRFVSEREIISEDFYSLTELYGHLNSVFVLPDIFYHYTINRKSLSRSFRTDRFERVKAFHTAMVGLSQKMSLEAELNQAIKSCTFGLIIGVMKLVVASKFKLNHRYREFKKIICDEFCQELVGTTKIGGAGFQKRLLYWATRRKATLICFLLVCLKNKSDT